MSDPVQTTSDGLCRLVRWAHSHGTICSLIPSLQYIMRGSYGNATPELGPHGGGGGGGGSGPVAVWGCGAGHAYHWPVGNHSNSCTGSANTSQGQERFVEGRSSKKVVARASCDPFCGEAASEGEEFSSRLFDSAGCDSSATDEDGDGDYEPCPARKRSATPGGSASSGGWDAAKKVKQEATSAEDYDAEADAAGLPRASRPPNGNNPCPQPQRLGDPPGKQDPDYEGLTDLKTEPPVGASCTTTATEQAETRSSAKESPERTAALQFMPVPSRPQGAQSELEKLRALLSAEHSRNQQMMAMISSLKQDKELLQHELAKKAELICDFLQDKLRPEKRWPHCSNQIEPGSSHMMSSDDVTEFESQTIFDSFDEFELHPLERHRTLKSKRSRDGENTRVRIKNVVGVIARYMAALQEFRRSVSMKVAFDRVGVDRNTISRTAAIAELSLAAPEVFHALAPWDEKEETLAHYAHRCRQAMDDTIKAKIKTMKTKGELLPILSK